MPIELFKKIIDDLGNRSRAIRLNGRGESTIHPYFNDMLTYVRDALPEVDINLFTNLSFNNDTLIYSFIKQGIQLFISIDSPIKNELEKIRKGCDYELIMNNIDQLNSIKNRPFIVFTIMEDNLHRIYDICKFAKINNLNVIYNTVRYDNSMEDFINLIDSKIEDIQVQFKKAEDLFIDSNLNLIYPDQISGVKLNLNTSTETYGDKDKCPSLESEMCITYNGLVTPCNMFNPYTYGNLGVQSITEVWNSDKRNYFINNYKRYYYCKDCACMG